MPRPVVMDASAGLAWIRDEPFGPAIGLLLQRHRSDLGEVLVPEVFWLEIANVMVRRYGHAPAAVVEEVRDFDDIGIRTVEGNRATWLLMLDRMTALGLSAYDAAYLALAESIDASLLTLDGSLAAAAGSRAVRIGPRRLAEPPAVYELAEPSEVWARFGEYLAQLRREALAG